MPDAKRAGADARGFGAGAVGLSAAVRVGLAACAEVAGACVAVHPSDGAAGACWRGVSAGDGVVDDVVT